MGENEFNPNSHDALFSGIKTELAQINGMLKELKETEKSNNTAVMTEIGSVKTSVTKSITDVNNKVVALEYFKWYLTGIATAAATVGSLLLTFLIQKYFKSGSN